MVKKIVSTFTIISFLLLGLLPYENVFAQEQLSLPSVGQILPLSPEFIPLMIKGLKIHKDNPFEFDFIVNQGQENITESQFEKDSLQLVKYFLASLAIPENDLWVNLSPYEKNRITTPELGDTEMGKDLLSQDYVLKQLTSSLIYPEGVTGKKFWAKVYALAEEKYHTTNVPINTFNKVWIVPQKAVVYENSTNETAYVIGSKLKVMLEQDYLSLQKHALASHSASLKDISSIGANIVREIVIPELTREVNYGKNFANLRQITNSLVLAAWYKRALKASILARLYVDQKKVTGVDLDDKTSTERIYKQYLRAYKKGVFNYIKEEADPISHEIVPRKYFSGGVVERFVIGQNLEIKNAVDSALLADKNDKAVTVQLKNTIADDAMLSGTKNQENRDRIRIQNEHRAEMVRGVFQPLFDLIKQHLEQFGKIDTPKRQEAFGNLYQEEVQYWLTVHRAEIENILELIPDPQSFERYKRNLILSLEIPGLGIISLYVHKANTNTGPGPHFHGIGEEREVGEMAFVAALNKGLRETRFPNITHKPGETSILLANPVITKLKSFEVSTLVDATYGAHIIEYKPTELLGAHDLAPHSAAFLELYLSPEPFDGFDSAVPLGSPNASEHVIIRAGSSLWVQHVNSVKAVARNEKWKIITDLIGAQDEISNSLSSKSPFIIFIYQEGRSNSAYAVLPNEDEIKNAFNGIQSGDIVYRGGPGNKYYLIVKRDRAMTVPPRVKDDYALFYEFLGNEEDHPQKWNGDDLERSAVAAFLTLAKSQEGENSESIKIKYLKALKSNSPLAAARYTADVAGQTGRDIIEGHRFSLPVLTKEAITKRVFGIDIHRYLKQQDGVNKISRLFDEIKSGKTNGNLSATEQLLYPATEHGVGPEKTFELYDSLGGSYDPEARAILVRAAVAYLPFSGIIKQDNAQTVRRELDIHHKSPEEPGGIDLNTADLDLQIKHDGNGNVLPVEFQNLKNIHINGLRPIYIKDVLITNLAEYLGATVLIGN